MRCLPAAPVSFLLAAALLATPAEADHDKHKGHKKHHKHEHHEERYDRGYYDGYRDGFYDGAITMAEYAIIRDYLWAYGPTPFVPGPGYAYAPAVGHPLPPGLMHRLPPRPGYEWRVVGRDIVLVALATGVIVGVLAGAL